MKNHKLLLPLITFLIFFSNVIRAQVNADFSMNQASGCSPLIVQFTNLSTGPDSLLYTYKWYLGPQQGTSVEINPAATYVTPGTFNVKLVTTYLSQKDSVTKQIVVYKNPTANFTADQKGCVPKTVQFNDASTKGDGNIEIWEWDLGTGSRIFQQNPSRVYTAAGKYNAFLKVTDENGCIATANKPEFIDIVNPPVATFSYTATSSCVVPATVNFSNSTTQSGTLTYSWTFGDNTSSTQTNPSKTYSAFGNYNVKLIANSDYGCSDTTTQIVYINQVNASGTISQNGVTINSGDTICAGIVDFASTSTGTGSVRWIFGDGSFSVSNSGFHNYTVSGLKKIMLVASPNDQQCSDTVSWNVYFEKPLANFSLSPAYSCKAPVDVVFTNQSTGDIKWTWTFPNGQTATTENASHNHTLPIETDPYIIHKDTLLYTTLTVESSHGCKSTSTKSLRIKKPTALFSIDKLSGCSPLKVRFTDMSISDESITSRKWVFGDNRDSTGNASIVDHIYLTDKTFSPYLVITNNGGCSDTSFVIPVKTGKKLLPDFTVDKPEVCPHELLQFTNSTPQSDLIEDWYYYIGDSMINKDTKEPDFSWKVIPDTGYIDVKLEVKYNGCLSDTVKENIFRNKGPVSKFSFDLECNSPLDYSFINTSLGYSSFKWNFGNVENTSVVHPSYSYASEGDSLVELISFKETCSDTARSLLHIRNVNAVIIADTLLCAMEPVKFDGGLSFSMPNLLSDKYSWYFEGSSSPQVTSKDTISCSFENRGYQDVKLVTQFDNGCSDSSILKVRVFKPFSNFSADTLFGCAPLLVNFSDSTSPDVHPLEQWHWVFEAGDDTVSPVKIPSISHWFNMPLSYNVMLQVTDTFGCIGSSSKTISTGNPSAEFMVNKYGSCVGENVIFYSLPQETDSMIWNFGDGFFSRSMERPVSHNYLENGEFNASLIVYRFGCADSFQLADKITIQKANAFFTASDTAWNCYPRLIIFNHDPGSQVIDGGSWNLGYGSGTVDYAGEVSTYYPKPGVYTPSLAISTSFGCRDTFSRSIIITGPTGDFSISDEDKEICKGDEIRYKLKSLTDVFDYAWDMADGTIFMKGDSVAHRYTEVGTFYPKLILYGDSLLGDSSGICETAIVDTIHVFRVVADFNMSDTGLCSGSVILFKNVSEGNETNNWNLNNTFFSTDADFQQQLTEGSYFVELLVRNSKGCSDTLNKTFNIYPLPAIQIMDDTLLCEGDSITIWATGGDEITWTPSSGLSANNIYFPKASPTESQTYTAVVRENAHGCRNYGNVFVFVQHQPDIQISPLTDDIIIGDSVQIIADSIGGFEYTWSPDYMINCINCASPWVKPLINTIYHLVVSDTNYCFTENFASNFTVTESYKLALPAAFKPNDENEENRVIKVRGHGIKRLVEFSIYNRWGNKVFFSDDLQLGWDGYFNGKLQGIDSYAYVIVAEMWDGSVQTKKGTISLLR